MRLDVGPRAALARDLLAALEAAEPSSRALPLRPGRSAQRIDLLWEVPDRAFARGPGRSAVESLRHRSPRSAKRRLGPLRRPADGWIIRALGRARRGVRPRPRRARHWSGPRARWRTPCGGQGPPAPRRRIPIWSALTSASSRLRPAIAPILPAQRMDPAAGSRHRAVARSEQAAVRPIQALGDRRQRRSGGATWTTGRGPGASAGDCAVAAVSAARVEGAGRGDGAPGFRPVAGRAARAHRAPGPLLPGRPGAEQI